jgi:hypothetical protein
VWSSTIATGAEHDAKSIEIPKLKAAALGPPRVGASATAPSSGATEQAPRKILPLALGGGAIVLGGIALGFELSARSTYSKAKSETDNDQQSSLWHSANTRRYVAEGLGVAGLACAGVAVWLYLRPGTESPSAAQASRVHVVPVVASDSAGLFVMGRY